MQIEHTTMTITITETGYGKGIMDTMDSLRICLKENKIYDYENQKQGNQHKKLVV